MSREVPSSHQAVARRNRLLRLAAASSAASKIAALGSQAFGLWLVVRTLSTHDYALFLILSAVLATMSLSQLGAGPGLTQQISAAAAADDRDAEATAFGSALAISAMLLSVTAAASLAVLCLVPVETLFGADYASDADVLVSTGKVCIALVCAHLFLGTIDFALAGYQEQVYTNVATTVTNVIATVALILVCAGTPSLAAIIIAMFAPPAAGRLVNWLWLMKRRAHLRRIRWSRYGIRQLLGSGLAFWVVQLATMVERNTPAFVLAKLSSPGELAAFGAIYRAIGLGMNGVSIVTQSLWPALLDARSRGDWRWLYASVSASRRLLLLCAIVFALGLSVGGPPLAPRILGVTLGAPTFAVLGVYVFLNVWTHMHYMNMMGLGSIWSIAWVIAAENVLLIIASLIAVPLWGALGMAIAYLIASSLLPAWYLPYLQARTLARINGGIASTDIHK